MDNTLEKVYKAGLKFLVPLTPEETYRTIVHEAMKLVGGESGAIMLEKDGQLQVAYSASPASFPHVSTRKKGFTYRAFKTHKSFVIHSSELSKIHPETVTGGVKSVAFIPLAYRNKSIGVLKVRSHSGGQFTHNEPLILQLFGSMASLAIRKTQLYDETRKALKTRDLFISLAAHEFRTPLTTIGGYVQLLADKLPQKDPQSKWVEELYWEVERLTSLVNELLETSRIKESKFQYVWRECRLKSIIKKTITAFQFKHLNHELVFVDKLHDDEDTVVGDFEKLLQVITNLVDNGAKFSDPGTKIVVSLQSRIPYLILTIKDQGRGIAEEDLPRIFEGFYRGNKVTERGMGLGLFLAKSIVEAHRGSIKIRSRVGKGTVVEVKLPRVKYG
ncbi:MAG: multi-sensor signal transduction histidine kinase [uncultured bacterium]|uniref:histidine kinase n=1 Tax=Candidatus Daviesbacteria bacterium RIFCSPHIGHO2_01_FULL_40_11 TaxID=1797762 RepID=A0A1F5JJK6_9BACT|nr:MAG: multi-sensor signal transduction histidine kinase [uncultured bacterium]OGE28786.1 MAG: hypothetical protein A2867_04145 [Candidatus Daviesbacteria bacterium RIFCSPHIGHO2_01_FULL_40_11]OGE62896.1 MAG: hypothetical protein A2964_01340 [Candidatus Daviesbacteria bacterium RIFCSPLOWO2_01_FULL_40_27]